MVLDAVRERLSSPTNNGRFSNQKKPQKHVCQYCFSFYLSEMVGTPQIILEMVGELSLWVVSLCVC